MSQLKKLVNDKPLYDAFLEYIQKRIDAHTSQMVTSREDLDMKRAQGAVIELKRMFNLREEINGRG